MAGVPVAVCARCLGVYVGAALGLLFRTARSFALRLLLAVAVLNFFDVASEFAGLHGNWLGVRFGLGLALGASAALLILSSTTDPEGSCRRLRPARTKLRRPRRWSEG